MSPAHGTLIKISNCMHLCLLAGLLKRQRPHHPSLPPSFITRGYYVCHPEAWVGEWPVPTKNPSFCHSLTSHFWSEESPYFKRQGGVWKNGAGGLYENSKDQKCGLCFTRGFCADYASVYAFLFSIEKKKWILLSLKHSIKIVKWSLFLVLNIYPFELDSVRWW